MQSSRIVAADVRDMTVRQIADQLAVVMWANGWLKDEVETIASHSACLGLNAVGRLEWLFASIRPVAETRSQLAQLDGNVLLGGFELWATRQRAVVNRLALSSGPE